MYVWESFSLSFNEPHVEKMSEHVAKTANHSEKKVRTNLLIYRSQTYEPTVRCVYDMDSVTVSNGQDGPYCVALVKCAMSINWTSYCSWNLCACVFFSSFIVGISDFVRIVVQQLFLVMCAALWRAPVHLISIVSADSHCPI